MKIKIYTDGACLGNPGPGGWAAIILTEGNKKEIFGGKKLTTNNRMELTAAIKALEYCFEKEGKQLIFFEKIDKNTSREQIKENIKNLLIKQGLKFVPSKKDNK